MQHRAPIRLPYALLIGRREAAVRDAPGALNRLPGFNSPNDPEADSFCYEASRNGPTTATYSLGWVEFGAWFAP